MTRFLRTLFGKTSTIRNAAKPAARSRLGMESLEAREVPSVSSVWWSGSTWVVKTDNASTSVNLSESGANLVLSEVGTTRTWTAPKSWVGLVEFQGGAGNDRFVNYSMNTPIRAFGFGGNDYLEGYNGNDQFIGGDGNDTLVGYGGNDQFWGDGGNDRIRGMDGNDYADGGTGDDTVAGNAGNDTIYGSDGDDQLTGGAGTDYLYGGNGADSLVTIDTGTTDYADGGAGYDTVWRDSNFVFPFFQYDTAYGEQMQNVMGFANGADRTLDGDNIADPTDGTFYKSFRDNALFGVGGPNVDDIDQNALGDCWILGALGGAVNDNQNLARRMVADFGDGTYGVRLGNNFYRVDGDLPTTSAASTNPIYAGLGHGGSLWVALIEKAYTHFRTGANTYASIAGGDPADALRAFNLGSVGQNYYAAGSNATTLANAIYNRWNSYQACDICTGTVGTSGLVGNHCYTVTGVTRNAAGVVTSIQLRNPWGGAGAYVSITPAQLATAQIWVTYGNTST